ncbi:MAG: hypothetical protein E6I74_08390 [Chloroflexi bacterium]|nr:MAG: hypothetical protein E6I74_08390 [Chloroflexota bacterium]
MWIVREVKAGLRVRGAPRGIDPERADLPVRRNGPHQKEDQDQPTEEQQKADLPAPATSPGAGRGLNGIAGLLRSHRQGDGVQRDAHLS